MAAEDTAPAHVREIPSWVTGLVALAKTDFTKRLTTVTEKLVKQGPIPFCMSVPLWYVNVEMFAVPSVWPLQGTVERACRRWHADDEAVEFPPLGHLLELAYYGTGIKAEDGGKFEREHVEALFLA